jgi:hypothetical protein
MKNAIKMLAAASILVAGSATAQEVTLTDAQMDGVTAGAVVLLQGAAVTNGSAAAIANVLGLTSADTGVVITPLLGFVSGFSVSAALANSVTDGVSIGGAVATSSAVSTSQLL